MDISSSATLGFDAGHGDHGHHWDVEVSVSGDLDPKSGFVRGAELLMPALRELLAEVDHRNLDEMLPGSVASPLGVAAWVLDRLALRFPRIVRVTVDCSDGTSGEIRRAPRQ